MKVYTFFEYSADAGAVRKVACRAKAPRGRAVTSPYLLSLHKKVERGVPFLVE